MNIKLLLIASILSKNKRRKLSDCRKSVDCKEPEICCYTSPDNPVIFFGKCMEKSLCDLMEMHDRYPRIK